LYSAALVVNVYVPAFTAWNVKAPFPFVVVVRPPGLNETVAPEIGVPSRLLTTVPVITPGAGSRRKLRAAQPPTGTVTVCVWATYPLADAVTE